MTNLTTYHFGTNFTYFFIDRQTERQGDGQYRGKENHRRCNCMRPAKHIRVKTKYSVCVVVEVYARKDESPPPMLKPLPALTWGW
jgi:hypothetical protein